MSDFSVNIGPRIARQGGSAAQVLSAVVPDPPQAIRALDNGTILKGVVQGRDPDGMTVIVTDKGAIRVAINPPPPAGTLVTLEVRIAGDRLQVLVLAMDNPQPAARTRPDLAAAAPDPLAASDPRPTGSEKAAAPAQQSSHSSAGTAATALAPAAIVSRTGIILDAIVVRGEAEALRQFMGAGSAGSQQSAGALQPARAAAPSEPMRGASGESQAGRPALAMPSVLQPALQAEIESLFDPKRLGVELPGNQRYAAPSQVGVQAGSPGAGHHRAQTSVNIPGATSGSIWMSLPAGLEIKVRVVLPDAAVAGDLTGSAARAGNEPDMSGRILGHTPTGATIVSTPFGALVLRRDLALPAGTEVLLILEQAGSPIAAPSAALAATSIQQFLLQASRGWPTLMEVIALLRGRAGAGQPMDAVARLPQAGPRLAAGILRTMRAIEQADVTALLGPAARSQQRTAGRREDAIGRLGLEIAQLSQFAGQKATSEWHCCFIPLWDDGVLRQINLFHRRSRHGKDSCRDQESGGSRFVVEVEMSRMGAFQFDGLVRGKRFDLVVRSRIALEREMRQDIGALFQQALEIGRYGGEIVFQTVRDFPVSPLESIARGETAVSA